MAAIYFPQKACFIRVGPDCKAWGDPYHLALDCEIIDQLAIVGGLDKPLSREDYREIGRLLQDHGLEPAMRRRKTGLSNIRRLAVR